MRILIIGGTHFVGHGMAQAALDAGHDVTLLHRNQTDELAGATHLLADRNGDLSLLAGLAWVRIFRKGPLLSRAEMSDAELPHVLVQLPVYNEPTVVERALAAAGAGMAILSRQQSVFTSAPASAEKEPEVSPT